jgi:putative MFS transporter
MDSSSEGGPHRSLSEAMDVAPLNRRYWMVSSTLIATITVEVFDFVLIGFFLAAVSSKWHLTFGVGAILLLAASIGGVVGSIFSGQVCGRIGRRLPLLAGLAALSVLTGAVAIVSEGDWVTIAALRFGAGFAIGVAGTAAGPLFIEATPLRQRTFLTGAMSAPITLGALVVPVLFGLLAPSIGWRGIMAIGGALTALIAILAWWIVPESARWLLAKGDTNSARASVAYMLNVKEDSLPLVSGIRADSTPPSYRTMLGHQKACWLVFLSWGAGATAYWGIAQWTPTLLPMLLHIDPAAGARMFVAVALAGGVGRILIAALTARIGRIRSGQLMGVGIIVFLVSEAMASTQTVGGISLFFILLVVGAIFVEGGFANLYPLAAEAFPVNLASYGMALYQIGHATGKLLGPLVIAVIAGSGNFITPKATVDAVRPAFLFLSLSGVVVLAAFVFLKPAANSIRRQIKAVT